MSSNSINFEEYDFIVDSSEWYNETTMVKINLLPKDFSKCYCLWEVSSNQPKIEPKKVLNNHSSNHPLKERLRGRIEKSYAKLGRIARFKNGFMIDRRTTEFWTLFEFIKVCTPDAVPSISKTCINLKREEPVKVKQIKRRSLSSCDSTTYEEPMSQDL